MCDRCQMLMINGIPCHETGCPEAWRDQERICQWCGQPFTPDSPRQRECSDECAAAFRGHDVEPVSPEEEEAWLQWHDDHEAERDA
jgi:hypothetical protein